MSDFNFMVSTEGLQDKGREIGKESKNIKECLEEINQARKLLDGWRSQNKEKYDNKLATELPKMSELTNVIDSYSAVAIQTSARLVDVENKIATAIDSDDDMAD